MTITEFLLARIAEDKAWAKAAIRTPNATHWHWVDPETDTPLTPDPFTQEYVGDGNGDLRTVEELRPVSWEGGAPLPDFVIKYGQETPAGAAGHIARHDPARVLAECKAKRRIVERCTAAIDNDPHDPDDPEWVGEVIDSLTYSHLYDLATVYSDHPDYRDEWRS